MKVNICSTKSVLTQDVYILHITDRHCVNKQINKNCKYVELTQSRGVGTITDSSKLPICILASGHELQKGAQYQDRSTVSRNMTRAL